MTAPARDTQKRSMASTASNVRHWLATLVPSGTMATVDGRSIDPASLTQARLWSHVAVHEAGHAVIGMVLGLPVLEVQIGDLESTEFGLMAGGTKFDAPEGDTRRLMREQPDQMGIVLMAGAASELEFYKGSISQGYHEDLKILRRGMGWLEGLNDAQQAVVTRYVAVAIQAVASHRLPIHRTAEALITRHRLSAHEVGEILEGARSES